MDEHTYRAILRQELKRDREEQIAPRLCCPPSTLTRKHTFVQRPKRQDARAPRYPYGDPK